MTDDEPRPRGRKPLSPSPTATLLALAELAGLVYNLHVDAGPSDYNGLWATGVLAALIAGTLGFDLKWPGRGDDK